MKKNFEVHELSKHEKLLIKIISKFPGVVERSANTRSPAIMASYALELANAFHRFYMFDPVLKSKERDLRLNLVNATKITMKNVLELLGIESLEAM